MLLAPSCVLPQGVITVETMDCEVRKRRCALRTHGMVVDFCYAVCTLVAWFQSTFGDKNIQELYKSTHECHLYMVDQYVMIDQSAIVAEPALQYGCQDIYFFTGQY